MDTKLIKQLILNNTSYDITIQEPIDNNQDTIKSKPKKNRCYSCNKKTKLTGITCNCGFNFCSIHRYPNEHDCTFDFKTTERLKLEALNCKIVDPKIDHI
jgi:predicted nucleic acid binding AN1-type Zn finger protein